MSPSSQVDDRRTTRARRVLLAVLVLLILLLIGTSYFLFTVLRPAGEFASTEELGGMEWIRSIYGYGDAPNELLSSPNDVAIAPDGTIWVTDQQQSRVLGFNPDGTYSRMLEKGRRNETPEALSFPTALEVDEDGLIYIADSPQDRVVVMSPFNEIVREFTVPTPLEIAVRGDRLVVGSTAGFVIFNPEGEVVKLVGTRGKGEDQFDNVRGLAIAEDGTIYALDTYNNRLSAYDRDGNRLWIRELGRPGNQTPLTGGGSQVGTSTAEASLQLPDRLAIDGAGRLVIVDPFDFSLTVLDPENGDLIAKYGQAGIAEGQFTYPSGIDYDPSRDWFAVADTFNSRVQIVRLPDSGGAATAPVSRALSGPLRACAIPLLLILIAIVVAVVMRRRRRQAEARDESDELREEETPVAL